jgi:membrane protease YdiL (CAAX protease family)
MNKKALINFDALKKGIVYLVLFFILPGLVTIPFSFFITKSTPLLENIETIISYIGTTIIFILISFKDIKKDIKSFSFKIFKKAVIYWLIGLAIMITSSFIISWIGVPTPPNEVTNDTNLLENPIVQIILGVICFPIIEEIVFRLSLKDLSSNKHIYAISTGLFFAMLHIPEAFTSPIMLLHLIPYAACGIAFGYCYKNTNNIMSTISTHALHNLLNVIEIFL